MFGVSIDGHANAFSENQVLVQNSTIPSFTLKSKIMQSVIIKSEKLW